MKPNKSRESIQYPILLTQETHEFLVGILKDAEREWVEEIKRLEKEADIWEQTYLDDARAIREQCVKTLAQLSRQLPEFSDYSSK